MTQDYADEIGADGYAPDAGAAAEKTKVLLRDEQKFTKARGRANRGRNKLAF